VYPFIRDLSFSLRSLRRSPGFTSIAILTLTLGIAGNIVVFTLINAALLRPLPYPEPRRLMVLQWQDQGDLSSAAFFMLKNHARSFSPVAALYVADLGMNISAGGSPQYVRALSVSHEFFRTVGVRPEIGDAFSADDDQPNAPRVAILSYGLWTHSFNRDPSALGRNVQANGETYKIIGIMSQGFRSFPDADIWLPLRLSPNSTDLGNEYTVIGRLAKGISEQQAQQELNGLAREYHLTYPLSAPLGGIVARQLEALLVERERTGLAILFAAVAFVFLIACTNVAILILVRAAASTQVIAIRAAFGPSRLRLVFSLLSESLLLSLTGGLLGLILAKESLPLILKLWPANLPLAARLTIDWHVVLFTLAVAVLSPLLFGLAPALKLSGVNIAQVLARTSRTASSSAESVRAVRLLVFTQMVLTIMLLAGTTLLARSLLNLYSVPAGFDPEHLFVAQLSLAGDKYRTTGSTGHLLDQITKQLKVFPGVDEAAALNGLPLEKSLNAPMHPVEMPLAVDEADEYRPVTPGYFLTLGIPLRSGRLFTTADIAGGTPVAIVNEVAARRWWPGSSPIGRLIKVDEAAGPQFADAPRQIVGVVANTRERGLGVPPPPTVFVPVAQTPDNITAFSNKTFLTSIVVRTSGQIDVSNQVRKAVQSVDPTLPLASFRPFTEVIDRSLANQRFMALVTVGFSVFALVLTGIGTHGLSNYQARLRAREIAIRMAVGASRTHILRMVIHQGAKLIFFAVLAGLVGSFITERLMGSLLYNIQSNSFVLILATGFLLGLVATLISLLTAIRAASIEPMAVLRNE
jgi:putative ABC transport system permease protein